MFLILVSENSIGLSTRPTRFATIIQHKNLYGIGQVYFLNRTNSSFAALWHQISYWLVQCLVTSKSQRQVKHFRYGFNARGINVIDFQKQAPKRWYFHVSFSNNVHPSTIPNQSHLSQKASSTKKMALPCRPSQVVSTPQPIFVHHAQLDSHRPDSISSEVEVGKIGSTLLSLGMKGCRGIIHFGKSCSLVWCILWATFGTSAFFHVCF
jgi:hypothetical protein